METLFRLFRHLSFAHTMAAYSEVGWYIVLIAVILHCFQVALNAISMALMVRVFGRRIFSDGLIEAMFFLNLSDLCFALPGLIFTIPALYENNSDVLSDHCLSMGAFTTFSALFSIGAMLILALNRFIVIVLGKTPSMKFAMFLKCFALPFGLGGLTIAISWPDAFVLKGSGTICWPAWDAPRMHTISLVFGLLLILCFVLVLFLYGSVIYKIQKTIHDTKQYFSAEILTGTNQQKKNVFQEEMEVARKISFILLVAILGWVLLDISIMYGAIDGGRLSAAFEDAAHFLNAFMGCLNPILVIWFNSALREHVKRIFSSRSRE